MAWAIAFMTDHTALAPNNVANEVDRYITWPGQALAYKIGQLRIQNLRREAENTLGPRFNVRSFHDTVLETGAVPLDLMERHVRTWIAKEKAKDGSR